MPSCEKCWRDAHRIALAQGSGVISVAEEYERLLEERADNPCTIEEQAGPEARQCPDCGRQTVHQHAHVCMLCGFEQRGHAKR